MRFENTGDLKSAEFVNVDLSGAHFRVSALPESTLHERVDEEWHHNWYANRDLDALDRR